MRVFTRNEEPLPDNKRDISLGGLGVETTQPLPEGTRAELTLVLPNHEVPLQLASEVVWCRTAGSYPGMGVRFVETAEAKRSRLAAFVDQLMKDSERL